MSSPEQRPHQLNEPEFAGAESVADNQVTPEQKTVHESVEAAVATIEKESTAVMSAAEQQLAEANDSVGLAPERAQVLLQRLNIRERMAEIGEMVTGLVEAAKKKITGEYSPTDITPGELTPRKFGGLLGGIKISMRLASGRQKAGMRKFVEKNLDLLTDGLGQDEDFAYALQGAVNAFTLDNEMRRSYHRNLELDALNEALAQNFHRVASIIDRDPAPNEPLLVRTAIKLMETDGVSEIVRDNIKAVLSQHFNRLLDRSEKIRGDRISLADFAFSQGSDELAQKMKDMFRRLGQKASERESPTVLVDLLELLFNKDEKTKSAAAELVSEEIKKFGVDPSIVNDWADAGPSAKAKMTVHEQCIAMMALEREQPGSVRTLHDEFGISDFARYPKEILLRQVEERDLTDKPYGVVMYPRSDWNGAFQDDRYFATLFEQLQNTHSLRIVEAGSKRDAARRLISLDRKYGDAHKIQFMILGGHGNENGIWFGHGNKNSLQREDLQGAGVRRTGSFFEPGAPLIISSCKVGKEGAIGQGISKDLAMNVIAPDKIQNGIRFLKVDTSTNPPQFEVTYGESPTVEYRSGQKQKPVINKRKEN